ncbi:MAG: IS110 family transposase, partial [Candidatus Omnitrophica bacterium]|nr:IS110 family transposase [Candidatus Omnitrophota bacterium]
IGVDYHKRFSHLTMIDAKERRVKEAKISNTSEALQNFLKESNNGKAMGVLEAGRNWEVMYDLLEEELSEVKLAHTYKVKVDASDKD